MTKELADALKAAADRLEFEVSLFEDYSGRVMYGKTTTGITVGSLIDLFPLLLNAGIQAGKAGTLDEQNELVEAARALRYDNLGRDFIVY